jgi:hypothetical protein
MDAIERRDSYMGQLCYQHDCEARTISSISEAAYIESLIGFKRRT